MRKIRAGDVVVAVKACTKQCRLCTAVAQGGLVVYDAETDYVSVAYSTRQLPVVMPRDRVKVIGNVRG